MNAVSSTASLLSGAPEDGHQIPPMRFRWITVVAIVLSVIISQVTDRGESFDWLLRLMIGGVSENDKMLGTSLSVEVILNYTGSLAGALVCYILPAAVYLRVLGTVKTLEGALSLTLLCFGFFVFFSPVLTFVGVDSS